MDPNKLGLGVMISMLSGNNNEEVIINLINSKITYLNLENDAIIIKTEQYSAKVFDDGQSCCESRYITTSDKLQEFIGATIISFDLKEVKGPEVEYGDHEIMFFQINTDRGAITFETHNEHNGYYGGFSIKMEPL